jgi:hypothetical protein
MGHDASKVLLGSVGSSAKEITAFDSDPATFLAGLAVSQSSTAGALSLLKSAGMRVGISIGKSLSNHKKTAVARSGESVPVRLALKRASGNATITSYANLVSGTDDSITVGATVFTAQAGAATLGDATFQAATSNNATATSLAAQINAHAVAGALVKAVATNAVVNLYAKAGGTGGNAIALAYTDNDTNVGATVSGAALSGGSDTISDVNYVTKGAKVYFNDTNGLADFSTSESTISDAVYVSGVLTGIDESGNSVPAALVDMPGGL